MLKFTSVSLEKSHTKMLAIPVCEDKDIHTDITIKRLIRQAAGLEEFSGEKDQQVILYNLANNKINRCFFYGLGPLEKLDSEKLRVFAGKAVKAAKTAKCDKLVIAVPGSDTMMPMQMPAILASLGEGALLSNHMFEAYKSKPKNISLKQISFYGPSKNSQKFGRLFKAVQAICSGTIAARDWVTTPSNDKPPMQLAKTITSAMQKSELKVKLLNEAKLKQQKFGAMLAVGKGSSNPPCLMEMVYSPAKAKKTLVLVGKGVTFDTGGINLKSSASLGAMKSDMSGAAVVAGAMLAVSKIKPRHKIVGILPLVENMPSGNATRPGDIVTSFAGKTVEIGNTDAEGRLILIDAMSYAIKKHRPDMLLDIATLTGACAVALGEKIAGVFSPDDELAQLICKSGESTFERCWRMPLPEDYKKLIKSKVADLNNLSESRYGGAITAALFLSEFTNDTRWAHIDIAGPSFSKKAGPYCNPGGTGFGVRLLCDFIARV
ncbi:MAG: leucyl aminopeptidase [Desulfobacteraceae bacterium]|nr:leucyl aminopeptidase [Desulfobacteraceae bacterium]